FFLPMTIDQNQFFTFSFYSRRADAYKIEDFTLVDRLKNPLSQALRNMLDVPLTSIPSRTTTPQSSKILEEKVRGFEGVIGKSHLLLNVLDHLTHVAPVDTTVLILGESGTGKEGIARSIHQISRRKGHAFIRIDCTSLPSNLI